MNSSFDTGFAESQPKSPLLWTDVAAEGNGYSNGLFTPFLPAPTRDITRDIESNCFTEPSRWSLSTAKRCLDFTVAAAALLVSWPLLILAAALVRLQSPGPVIFRQERVGQGGKLFTLFKFRTMQVTSEQNGPSLTRSGDPRITKFGRFLRKYKMDELPQLINVLRGEMSLIGPRPKVPHLEVMEMPFRPGLTGAATLAFRCEEEMLQDIPTHELESYYCREIQPLKAKLDREYMRQATFASDLSMLYQTATACISRRPNQFTVDLT
jgi:lipopolysaccharide/colanic/teichoic acid biosynthesis glycosyltransferase